MKKSLIFTALLAGASVLGNLGFGQEGVKVQAPGVRVETRAAANHAVARAFRASKVIGAEVRNTEGTSLGKVDDLIMDERGMGRYVILSHGGVLGVGTKYYAVPFRVVAVKSKEDNSDARWIELNVTPQTLDRAPTFTNDKWPDFNEGSFIKETDTYFIDAPGVKVSVDR